MIGNIIEAFYELAIKEGAEIRGNSRVVKIEPMDDIVKVILEDGTEFTANSLILSVGAWQSNC